VRPLFANEPRDETGAIILGDPDAGCPYCGAPPEPTYSRCGRVVWWHPPLECCDRRRALTRAAFAAGKRDYEEQDRADRADRGAVGVRP